MTDTLTYMNPCGCPGFCDCTRCFCGDAAHVRERENAACGIAEAMHMAETTLAGKLQQLFTVRADRNVEITPSRALESMGYSRSDAMALMKEEL